MDPLTGAALIMGSQAVKLLVGGGAVSRSDLGELASGLLTTFFEGAGGVSDFERRLADLERKIDLLGLQNFQQPYGVARHHLRHAAEEVRAGRYPVSCERAREQFLEAEAGAQHALHKVQAYLGAALCSLFLGWPEAAAHEAKEAWSWGFFRLVTTILDFGSNSSRARAAARDEALREAQTLAPFLQGVRALREQLGVPDFDRPRFWLECGPDLAGVLRLSLHVRTQGTKLRLPGRIEASSDVEWTGATGRPSSLHASGWFEIEHRRDDDLYAWSCGVRGAEIDRPYPWFFLRERDYHMRERPLDAEIQRRPGRLEVDAVVAPGDAIGIALSGSRGQPGTPRWPEVTLAFAAPDLARAAPVARRARVT